MTASFSTLALKPQLIDNLSSLSYTKMTEIQQQSLPIMLQGKDVIAQAKTGSGKTAAFALTLLNALNVKSFRIQGLILCPTRELADQVAKEIRKLARSLHNIKVLTLCGGMPLGPQIGSLEHGAHIIVGTPGRVQKHLSKSTLNLDHLTHFVLDEADRMLDMGFQEAINEIAQQMPPQGSGQGHRQTLLFSATYPAEIKNIAKGLMHQPENIVASSRHLSSNIEQTFYCVEPSEHRPAIKALLLTYPCDSTIIFCNTKREAQELANELNDFGFDASSLHGDLEQRQREQALVRFENKSTRILVATDVAARGLDIAKLDLVINFQMARELAVHIHRIGRTGRAGETGIALTLFTDKERYKFKQLQEYLDQSFDDQAVPLEILSQQQPYKATMTTLQIQGGKKQKVRAGDILGALTANADISRDQVGKIHIFDQVSYVAINRNIGKTALNQLKEGKIKGKYFPVRFC